MLRIALTQLLQSVVDNLVAEGRLPAGLPAVTIEDPKDPSHGDFATNFALVASKAAGMPPRQLAEIVAEAITSQTPPPSPLPAKRGIRGEGEPGPAIQSVDVAGPGFINLRLDPEYVASYVSHVLSAGVEFKRSAALATKVKQRINVEFVSVNPNGPITIGSGRGAAFGSTLANVLEAAGHTVHREYYINDGVNSEQMRLFAESVRALALNTAIPQNGYRGDYVQDVSNRLSVMGDLQDQIGFWQQRSQELMLERQRTDLAAFGTTFDTWFSEQSLHDAGVVEREIAALEAKGAADSQPIRHKLKLAKGGVIEDVEVEEQAGDSGEDDGTPPTTEGATPPPSPLPATQDIRGEGELGTEGHNPQSTIHNQPTLWLRSTKFGDDMDRVIRRKDGRLTYIASDVAYHKDKFNRPANADKLITILGPDHHGYIGRLHAVLAAVEVEGMAERSNGERSNSGTAVRPDDLTTSRPLSEIEAKLYALLEERDACKAALDKARKELDVIIYQLVRFMKDGKPAPMRKRDGNIYAIIDLIDEIGKKVKPEESQVEQRKVGKDVARFFYLMRSHDTTFDFDLDLAEKQSDENPVFYVQYAHARICSVIRKAEEAGLPHNPQSTTHNLLVHPKETALIKKILDLPHEVSRAAEDYGVHRLTTYGIELARAYHHFYDACRVIQPEHPELSQARLALCEATKIALQATFDLLGIEAPEHM